MSTNGKTSSQMSVSQLHHAAMEAFDAAEERFKAGDPAEADVFYRNALEKESEAASRVASRYDFEPTRSVLHRSAASVALRCREFRAAERLIAVALSGDPPEEIAEELRSLLDQVNFERHMQLRGLKLAPNEMQLSIAGDAVGHGIAESEEFVGRVQVVEKLLMRTIERRGGRDFRESGRPSKETSDRYQLYLAAPQPGSLSVTLRVGLPEDQLYLTGMEDQAPISGSDAVREVIECLEAVNGNQEQRLRELIPEEAYRRNFVGLARQLAPDGERVKLVGLTTEVGPSDKKLVALDRRRDDVFLQVEGVKRTKGDLVEVVGRLLFANATSQSNSIRIIDDAGDPHSFVVPAGMMADIVRPLWGSRVKATGVRKGDKRVELRDINPFRELASSNK